MIMDLKARSVHPLFAPIVTTLKTLILEGYAIILLFFGFIVFRLSMVLFIV